MVVWHTLSAQRGSQIATLGGPEYILYGYTGPLDGLGSLWSFLQGLGHTGCRVEDLIGGQSLDIRVRVASFRV